MTQLDTGATATTLNDSDLAQIVSKEIAGIEMYEPEGGQEAPLDMIQKVIAEWRNGEYDTNLEALLAVDAIMNSGDSPVAENAWANSVLRDLKINEVAKD